MGVLVELGLAALRQKMGLYRVNGALLGWLLIPEQQAVEIWRSDQGEPERLKSFWPGPGPNWYRSTAKLVGLGLAWCPPAIAFDGVIWLAELASCRFAGPVALAPGGAHPAVARAPSLVCPCLLVAVVWPWLCAYNPGLTLARLANSCPPAVEQLAPGRCLASCSAGSFDADPPGVAEPFPRYPAPSDRGGDSLWPAAKSS
jgi:hypothetical protein